MLVLSRRSGERIVIDTPDGRHIVLTVCRIEPHKVRLGIDAPTDHPIYREELRPHFSQE